MDQDLVDTLCVVLRDVVALCKSEGPTLIVPFFLKKTGGTQSTFFTLDAFIVHLLMYLSSDPLHRMSVLFSFSFSFLIRPLTSEEGVYKLSDTIL